MPDDKVIRDKVITVLVVDDHDLLREGVSSSLAGFEDLELRRAAPRPRRSW